LETPSTIGRFSVRASLAVAGLYGALLLLLYRETTMSMVDIWSRSDTFAHGFLILPIAIWLVWTRRELLAAVQPEPAWWVALLIIPPGMAWLLAWLVDVVVGQQLALVAILIVGSWAILGHRLAGVLAFPLFFLFFAVPMGEGLIAPMMEFTATSTVWLIKMSGIPVYREGLMFALPTGSWSVVEACSGVRYIIASVTVGVLYAYLTYRSWTRRVIFVLVSAIVPVFANTLRAYIIVMLGHFSNMKIATGADHLIYGWVFFGIVIFVMFWLGSFFREDQLAAIQDDSQGQEVHNQSDGSHRSLVGTLLIALVIASLPHTLATTLFAPSGSDATASPKLPLLQSEWIVSAQSGWQWSPPSRVSGQASELYERDAEAVKLFVQFADGSTGREDVVGSSSLFALDYIDWTVVSREKRTIQVQSTELSVDEALIRGGRSELLVWSWYLVGDQSTSNDYWAKLHQTLARVGLGEPGAYRIVLATPVYSSPDRARMQLRDFVNANAPVVYEELRRAAAISR
jgi:exosortase A